MIQNSSIFSHKTQVSFGEVIMSFGTKLSVFCRRTILGVFFSHKILVLARSLFHIVRPIHSVPNIKALQVSAKVRPSKEGSELKTLFVPYGAFVLMAFKPTQHTPTHAHTHRRAHTQTQISRAMGEDWAEQNREAKGQ